eukprot:scaffold15068_cov34-Cylindrotheca_fusiformis.AAC.1
MFSLKTGSRKVRCPSLISLQLCAVVFILTISHQTEHAFAFGFFQQPTRCFSQSSSRFEPMFAKPYDRSGDQGRARKANHRQRTRGPSNAFNPQDL